MFPDSENTFVHFDDDRSNAQDDLYVQWMIGLQFCRETIVWVAVHQFGELG